MAYNPTTWKDQIVTDSTRYKITKQDGNEEVVNIEREPGEIVQEGTRVTAVRLNNIEQGINDNTNEIDTVGTQMADLATKLENYNSYASNIDVNGIYTVVEYKRTDASLYMKSTLSNVNANGYYQTDTWQFYDTDGTTLTHTLTWTITYNADGGIVSKVVS